MLINWIYVFITTYITGRFILTKAYKCLKYETKVQIAPAVAAGLAFTTVYAGYFSVFYKVGQLANAILIIACITMAVVDREYYRHIPSMAIRAINKYKHDRKAIIKSILIVIAFIAVLFFTTEGQFFSDSGYYHEQSIRWIEEFGAVRGSVHVLKRLAYNSSYFCQCALFSMRDLFGQSLHCLGGFYALFVIMHSIIGFDKHIKTNTLRIAPIIYFIMFCSEIISPASDFPLTFIVMYVAIRWFELRDEEQIQGNLKTLEMDNAYAPYAMLSLFVVFIISIKLTVGCLVLIVTYPAITMIKERKIKEITTFIGLGIGTILPYFIRNYIICGWLIYPFTKIDLFNPDWKIVAEAVQADADEIKVWGRGMGQIGGVPNDGIRTWLPHWWNYMAEPDRKIIISLIGVGILYIAYRVVGLLNCYINTKIKVNNENIDETKSLVLHRGVFEVAVLLSVFYWFFESPLFRYGVVYILIAVFYMLGYMLEVSFSKYIKERNRTWRIMVMLGMTLVCLFPTIKSLVEYLKWDYICVRYMSNFSYVVNQEDYPRVEYEETDIDGITFYYPSEELGQIGYHIFPALWYGDTSGIELRGNKIREGFRSAD